MATGRACVCVTKSACSDGIKESDGDGRGDGDGRLWGCCQLRGLVPAPLWLPLAVRLPCRGHRPLVPRSSRSCWFHRALETAFTELWKLLVPWSSKSCAVAPCHSRLYLRRGAFVHSRPSTSAERSRFPDTRSLGSDSRLQPGSTDAAFATDFAVLDSFYETSSINACCWSKGQVALRIPQDVQRVLASVRVMTGDLAPLARWKKPCNPHKAYNQQIPAGHGRKASRPAMAREQQCRGAVRVWRCGFGIVAQAVQRCPPHAAARQSRVRQAV
eukprot:352525-Chlamydomonas_euryale.AAC.2